MKKTLAILFLLVIAALSIKGQPSSAGNWQNLFNGKDLTGWKQLNGQARYSVENNEIVGTTVHGQPNSFLATEKDYGDFILELELKMDSMMNSGIQIRSESSPDFNNGRVHGYQVEIDPSLRSWSGGLYDEAGRGWLYTLELNRKAMKAYRHGEWNKYRVECIGNTIRTWVNGIATAHLIDDKTPRGFIALQVHSIGTAAEAGRTIKWRNIRIQTSNLRPSPYDDIFVVNLLSNNLSAQEKRNGFSLLWDGKSANGWRSVRSNSFPEKGWEIRDGVLNVVSSQGGSDIVTTSQYKSFILQFEFKLTEGANSGVKYFVSDTKNFGTVGLEYQVLDDEKHPDAKMGVNGNRTLGSLYDLIPSRKIGASQKKIGEWNRGMIVVHPDSRVEHWLNGYKVLEYERGGLLYNELVQKSKYKQIPNFGFPESGPILIQHHGDNVSFRSIKIKKM